MRHDTDVQTSVGVERLAFDLPAARTADWTKNDRLSVVNHERKTPINGILGPLRATDLDEDQSQVVNLLRDSATSAVRHCHRPDRGHDGRRATAGVGNGHDLPLCHVRPSRRSPAPCRRRQGPDAAGDLGVRASRLRGRRGRVPAGETNIVGNAVKFPDTGGTEVSAQFAFGTRTRRAVEVEDTGPGIPCTDRAHAFERYAHGANGTRAEGSGLGLAIGAGLVETTGGTIALRSKPEVGTTFTVALPFGGEDRLQSQESSEL